MSGCGSGNTADDSSGVRVCVATNSEGLVAHTFNKLTVDGAQGAGARVQVVASKTPNDYLAGLQRCLAARPNLIMAVSGDMAPAIWQAAQQHASQRFALVDATPVDDKGQSVDMPNVSDVLFNEQEPGDLVGGLPGLLQ